MDSTGVSHILEHTVLCGSQSYPVRDPFFKMLNRSLSTFMNAFTGIGSQWFHFNIFLNRENSIYLWGWWPIQPQGTCTTLSQSYILSHTCKTVNTRENSWNVYCFAPNQMQDETAKGSLQTTTLFWDCCFSLMAIALNLLAASDFTMYPFSTQNSKDFENLLSVYLDAAFFPHLREQDFWWVCNTGNIFWECCL